VIVTLHGRTLDQVTRYDEQSLQPQYLVGERLTPVEPRPQFWVPGQTLDQQNEGACVPHGITQDAISSPVRVRLDDPQALAWQGYDWTRRNDEWPGEDYSGTSVNAGMKWYRDLGLIDAWWWCRSIEDLIQAIIQIGPAVIGIPWREGMYETRSDGLVEVHGRVVGGHCIHVNGYSPSYRRLGEVFRWKNSWGNGYGINGQGWIKTDAFDYLAFRGQGEVAIPVGRRLKKDEVALAG
jgi:hypothetical protein